MKRLALALLALPAATATGAATAASPDLRIANDIVLTRQDGTTVAVKPVLRVYCGPWEQDVRKPSIHVEAGARGARLGRGAGGEEGHRKPIRRLPPRLRFHKPTQTQ